MLKDFTSFSRFTFNTKDEWYNFKSSGGGEGIKQLLSTEWFEPKKSGIEELNL